MLSQETVEKIREGHETLYDQNRRVSEIYRSINLPIPQEIRFAAELTLERRLRKAIVALSEGKFALKKTLSISRIMKDAKAFSVELDKTEIAKFLSRELMQRINRLEQDTTLDGLVECLNINRLASKIEVEIDQRESQDCLFFLIRKWEEKKSQIPEIIRNNAEQFVRLLREFHIQPDRFNTLMALLGANQTF